MVGSHKIYIEQHCILTRLLKVTFTYVRFTCETISYQNVRICSVIMTDSMTHSNYQVLWNPTDPFRVLQFLFGCNVTSLLPPLFD